VSNPVDAPKVCGECECYSVPVIAATNRWLAHNCRAYRLLLPPERTACRTIRAVKRDSDDGQGVLL
jgi:hypothetical protein